MKSKEYDLNLVATGDSLITRRLSIYDDERHLSLMKIIRKADVAFTNLETTIHDYKGYPATESGGGWMISPPHIAEELKWIGFNLLSRANNHSMDWAEGGMTATSNLLDRAGLVHAGVGQNLSEARAPAYLDTKKGRVALISTASTFPKLGRAGEARRDMKGRPGLNPLRYDTHYVVNLDDLNKMKEIASKIGRRKVENDDEISFLGKRFVLGEKPGTYRTANKLDVEGNIRSIKDARRQADWVLVSVHSHEYIGVREVPAKFIVSFAHEFIDAGADAYIGHGAHVLQGIEIYKDKPIFYGLGNFIHQNLALERIPEDSYEKFGLSREATPADFFDAREDARTPEDAAAHGPMGRGMNTILAWSSFKEGKITELKLYPISLGQGKSRPQIGRPQLTDEKLGSEIIEHMAKISSVYGTDIVYRDGIGEVKL